MPASELTHSFVRCCSSRKHDWPICLMPEIVAPASRASRTGTWIDDEALRTQPSRRSALPCAAAFASGTSRRCRSTRPLNDPRCCSLRIGVTERGEPTAPAKPSLLVRGSRCPVTPRRAWRCCRRRRPLTRAVDAAWLVQATSGDMYARRQARSTIRVWPACFAHCHDADADLAASVIHDDAPRRMLLGARPHWCARPEDFTRLSRRATCSTARRSVLDDVAAAGVLAHHRAHGGHRHVDACGHLTQSLFALPVASGDFHGALADWFQRVAAKPPRGVNWQARAVAGGWRSNPARRSSKCRKDALFHRPCRWRTASHHRRCRNIKVVLTSILRSR